MSDVENVSIWNGTSENISKKAPDRFGVQVGDINISDNLKKKRRV